MSVQTACSTKPLPDAILELRAQLREAKPKVVLYFASSQHDAAALSQQMHDAFPDASVAGCSTAGEISGGQMRQGSIAVMSLDDEEVDDAAVVLVEGLGAGMDLAKPFQVLEAHFQAPAAAWDFERYVGLVLVDGMSGAEERLMEKLGDMTDVLFVGGSAGDDLEFRTTHVYAEGKASTNSAVLLLMRLRRGFEIVKTQSFEPIGRSLVATDVDEERRTVLQFDHKPALEAYADALGVAAAGAPSHFFEHPLGLMVDGEPYVRSPQRAEGSAMVFYCRIKEGMELEVLKATDIVADTRKAIEARRAALTPIHGMIDFHCILRTLQLRAEQRCDEYAGIFHDIPMIGFSTYGEAYLGHLNQTSTILVFD